MSISHIVGHLAYILPIVVEATCSLCDIVYYVGAQIIDLMLLVVDATKGMQTQTAEVSLSGPNIY